MPVITLDGPFLSLEKKEKIVKEFTELASEITNIPKEAFVIFIKENACLLYTSPSPRD